MKAKEFLDMEKKQAVDIEKLIGEIELDILTGVLKPRERLVEFDLMDKYGLNRNTIRMILKELQLKQLVAHYPNRGMMVAELSEKEIEDIYYVRILLENSAADMVVKNSDDNIMSRIKQYGSDFENFVRENNFRGMVVSNFSFHQVIFQMSGNVVLTGMIDQLRTRSHLLRHYIWREPGRLEQSLIEHEALINFINDKDIKSFKELNEKHILAGIKKYTQDVRDLNDSNDIALTKFIISK